MNQSKTPYHYIVSALLVLLLSACSNTRFLKDDQVLYVGINKIKIIGKEEIKKVKSASEILDGIVSVKPNNSLLGTKRVTPPIGLWTYNYLKYKNGNKKGKEGGWIYRNFNEPPVLISTVNPALRADQIEIELFDLGFFNAKATYEIIKKKSNPRKAKITYTVIADSIYRINKIITPPPADAIDTFINKHLEDFNLKPGAIFNLELIKSEKRNIASELVEQGYYFFSPDNIEFIADTSITPYKIDLMIRKESQIPEFILQKYTIDKIKVNFSDNQFDTLQQYEPNDSLYYDDVYIIGCNNYLKPETIRSCIQFESGDLYSTKQHQSTIKQLNNYSVFRNVKVQFLLSDTIRHKLDMFIDLSPKENVSINLEGYVQTKSTGFTGPGLEASISNGNIGRAANRLQLKVNGGFEWQIANQSGENLGSNSYNAGINTSFIFPRLVLPFKIKGVHNLLSSETIVDLGFEFLNNVRYYRMTSLTAAYSYQWKKKQKITNTFSPAKINMVNLLETTNEFDNIVESNIYVKKSFEEQTIIGMEYNFIYDNTSRKSNGTYFQAIVSTSGNLASTISKANNSEKPYTILSNVFSQFIKTSLDFRYFTRTTKKGLVFRIYSGVGYSYGNSTVMPYIEQFYSGGSTSLRAFAARSIGPGSYQPVEQNGIVDQTGDIKLEFNAEYRVPFSDMVHGALFADVGNVWLLNTDENRPGAEFEFSKFGNQLAFGSGLGLRFDFDFFVLRTDVGFPLRNNYEKDGSYWLNSFSDVVSGYRFNLAIGYPF
ncbi:MAG: BamA/TamA family outer membrane protein [Bacteroidetes bacterium]|nr:BamA/TamA family outer membrane protein [Bacteroidota bacterium]